jgi:hypothetical protein
MPKNVNKLCIQTLSARPQQAHFPPQIINKILKVKSQFAHNIQQREIIMNSNLAFYEPYSNARYPFIPSFMGRGLTQPPAPVLPHFKRAVRGADVDLGQPLARRTDLLHERGHHPCRGLKPGGGTAPTLVHTQKPHTQ